MTAPNGETTPGPDDTQRPTARTFPEHPRVVRVRGEQTAGAKRAPDKTPETIALAGYLGRDDDKGYWRIYDTLLFSSYVRVHGDDISSVEQSEDDVRPSLVTIRGTATVEHRQNHRSQAPHDDRRSGSAEERLWLSGDDPGSGSDDPEPAPQPGAGVQFGTLALDTRVCTAVASNSCADNVADAAAGERGAGG